MTRSQIIKYAPLLKYLAKASPKERRSILRKRESKQILDILSECCVNVLHGNIKINPKQHRKLSKYKKQIRDISSNRTSGKRKREIVQRGGFLGALIPSIIAPLLGKLFG